MRKRIFSIAIVIILVLSIFTACSSRAKDSISTEGAVNKGMSNNEFYGEDISETPQDAEAQPESDDALAVTGSGSGEQSAINAVLADRKIIRNAHVTIEVEKFDDAYSKLNSMLTGIGFIQESNIDTERAYIDNEMKLLKHGVIVIRVDKDKFDKVFNNVKGLGIATSERMGVEDVTSKYLDVDSRLRLLRYEESRLEEYLKKLDDPDKIFKTQSRLTDIRHEIESLTITLKKLNDLIDLSTITINMHEIRPDAKNPPAKKTYADRLLGNFLDSLKNVIAFCGEIVIIFFQLIPVLIIMGFFGFIALLIYKRTSRKGKNVFPKSDEKKDKDE